MTSFMVDVAVTRPISLSRSVSTGEARVGAGMHAEVVDPKPLQLPDPLRQIVHAEQIGHDLEAAGMRDLDHAGNRGIGRGRQHGHERRAGIDRELRFERAAVDDLEIGHDRQSGDLAQLGDHADAEPFDERGARFDDVDDLAQGCRQGDRLFDGQGIDGNLQSGSLAWAIVLVELRVEPRGKRRPGLKPGATA